MAEEDIQRSINHYNELSDDEKQLINDYKSEMDPDDWEENPLKISYVVINWLLKKKEKDPGYLPELIESGVISNEELIQQVESAEKLYNILESFPPIKNKDGIIVYRGKTCGNIEKIKNNTDITMYNFLSTSTSFEVSKRFASSEDPCIMRIHISPGTPLSYISEPTESEAEILLPPGSTFNLKNKIKEGIYNIYDFELVRFGRIRTRNFWPEYKKLAQSTKRKRSSSSSINRKNRRSVSSGGKKYTKIYIKKRKTRRNKKH